MEGTKQSKISHLVTDLKKGDTNAFDELFRIYGKHIYHFALGYLKSKEEAEEIVQNLFLKIWDNRHYLNPDHSFQSYLFTIASHDITAAFKRIQRARFYLHDITFEASAYTDDFEQQINFQSLLSLVGDIISGLPDRQRDILLMRKMSGMHVDEIARQLKISVKTVEHHITEALKTIRKRLADENPSKLLLFLFATKNFR